MRVRRIGGTGLVAAALLSAAACTVPSTPPTSTTTTTSSTTSSSTTTTAPGSPHGTPFDFDGDGRADLVYFNGQTAAAYRVGDPATVLWTANGIPAPGDYDGDGRWELGSVRLCSGSNLGGPWATNGTRGTIDFPAPSCPTAPNGHAVRPVPARYDGGATLPAWYVETEGTWYVEGHAPVQFGNPDDGGSVYDPDYPVPGDYNGDGIDEPAVYRPKTGQFLILGQAPVTLGSPAQIPVPADYDGDGKIDPATYDGTTWHIAGVGDVTSPFPANSSLTDIPVPADHDGNSRADLALFRTNNSTVNDWYIASQAGPITLDATRSPIPATVPMLQPELQLRLSYLRGCLAANTGPC